MAGAPTTTSRRRIALSAPAVKRRVDKLRATGALQGFTAVIDHTAIGAHTEALIELFFAPGTLLDAVAKILRRHPEVVEAWSVTGEADAIARVRTEDNTDLERLIMELQKDGMVERTRSQVVLSELVEIGDAPRPPDPAPLALSVPGQCEDRRAGCGQPHLVCAEDAADHGHSLATSQEPGRCLAAEALPGQRDVTRGPGVRSQQAF